MSLTKLKRKYIVQLILAYIPFLVTLVISNVLPKYLIDYKLPLILILLIGSLLYSYILLLKNHLDDLEEKNKLLIGSAIDQNKNIPQPQRELRPSEIHHRLAGLSKKEKEYLKKFLDADSRTLKFPMDDEIADGLRSLGILQFVSKVATFHQFSYSVSPIYWDHLKKRPDAIGL